MQISVGSPFSDTNFSYTRTQQPESILKNGTLPRASHRARGTGNGYGVHGNPGLNNGFSVAFDGITDLNGDVGGGGLNGDIIGLNGDVVGLNGDVANLNGGLVGPNGDVGNLNAGVGIMNGGVGNMNGGVSSFNGLEDGQVVDDETAITTYYDEDNVCGVGNGDVGATSPLLGNGIIGNGGVVTTEPTAAVATSAGRPEKPYPQAQMLKDHDLGSIHK